MRNINKISFLIDKKHKPQNKKSRQYIYEFNLQRWWKLNTVKKSTNTRQYFISKMTSRYRSKTSVDNIYNKCHQIKFIKRNHDNVYISIGLAFNIWFIQTYDTDLRESLHAWPTNQLSIRWFTVSSSTSGYLLFLNQFFILNILILKAKIFSLWQCNLFSYL